MIDEGAYCRVCKKPMRTIVKEALGESYWCDGCGALIDILHDKPLIIFDRIDPLQATRENGEGE